MKKIKLRIVVYFLVTLSLTLTSCMTTKTNVGAYKETQGSEYTYAKGKQLWLFWGILPLGRTNISTPVDGNCKVITRFNVADALISCLTVGILTSHTIKIKAKKKY